MSRRRFAVVTAAILVSAFAFVAQAALRGIEGGRVKIEGNARPALGKFPGRINGVSVKEEGDNLVFTADLASKLDMGVRADHTKEAFEIGKFGTAKLSVEKAKLKMPADKEKVSGAVSAKLTLRGVTKPVNVKYTASRTGSDYHVKSASFTFKYTDFGVPEIKKMALKVDPEVTITVEGIKLRE